MKISFDLVELLEDKGNQIFGGEGPMSGVYFGKTQKRVISHD